MHWEDYYRAEAYRYAVEVGRPIRWARSYALYRGDLQENETGAQWDQRVRWEVEQRIPVPADFDRIKRNRARLAYVGYRFGLMWIGGYAFYGAAIGIHNPDEALTALSGTAALALPSTFAVFLVRAWGRGVLWR